MDSIPMEYLAKRVSAIGCDILRLLSKAEDMSRSEIENKLRLSPFKGSEQITCLYAAGLIDYNRADNDFRLKMFKITSYGLEILKQI